MSSEWVVGFAAVAVSPFVLLFVAKLLGYGFAAGRYKFEQKRRRDDHAS